MLRKRYIIETINNMLKNMAQIVHSRHRSVNDFIMNLIYALGAYVATRGCVKTPNIKILNSLCVHLWMRNEFFIFL